MKRFFMKLLKNRLSDKTSSNESPFFSRLLIGGLIGGSGFGALIFLIVIIAVLFSPVFFAEDLFGGKSYADTTDYCGTMCDSADKKVYQKIEEVKSTYSGRGVNIDTDLITGTIFYGRSFNSGITDDSDTDELVDDYKVHVSDVKKLASNMVSGNSLDYNKYRNYLVNTYIPKRFSDFYSSDSRIEQIADEIMSYASYSGSDLAVGNSIGASCSSITLKSQDGSITVHELEEYVAGVVTAENGGAGDEALKLQAIAARSFAVKNCDRVIVNSIGDVKVDGKIDQAYKEPSDRAIAAAEATKGKVLTYNGEIFDISFASYPKANYRGGFPGYEAMGYLCSDVSCNSSSDGRNWCTTTLYKQPNMEVFELRMPDTSNTGSLWNGLHLSNQGGHCYGISQVATIYYENELNYTYEQMVDEFLSPGVVISSMSSGFSGEVGSTEGTTFLAYELNRFLNEKGSSVDSFNQSIKQSVISAGPGTREGVVASVNALVNGLSQYGIKLPYVSSVDGQDRGKYRSYGVDPQWGTNGSYHSSYYHHTYTQLGLDCSGLVSWAIHNGGFKYLELNSSGFKNNVGTLHSYGTFKGQAGDLLVVDGHIGIIVGVTDSQYIIAEERGWQNGLVITYHSLTSDHTFKYVIDMTSYYSNSSNMDLSYYQGG